MIIDNLEIMVVVEKYERQFLEEAFQQVMVNVGLKKHYMFEELFNNILLLAKQLEKNAKTQEKIRLEENYEK